MLNAYVGVKNPFVEQTLDISKKKMIFIKYALKNKIIIVLYWSIYFFNYTPKSELVNISEWQ